MGFFSIAIWTFVRGFRLMQPRNGRIDCLSVADGIIWSLSHYVYTPSIEIHVPIWGFVKKSRCLFRWRWYRRTRKEWSKKKREKYLQFIFCCKFSTLYEILLLGWPLRKDIGKEHSSPSLFFRVLEITWLCILQLFGLISDIQIPINLISSFPLLG